MSEYCGKYAIYDFTRKHEVFTRLKSQFNEWLNEAMILQGETLIKEADINYLRKAIETAKATLEYQMKVYYCRWLVVSCHIF